MFILFDSTLWNTNAVLKISRAVAPDLTVEKPYAICLRTAQEEIFERFKGEHSMNRRFNELSEQVGATQEKGC